MRVTQITEPLPGIDAGDGNHRIFDHGAHVCAWQPVGHPHPVLWVSSASPFADGKAIRGGIPICFPWFGAGRYLAFTPCTSWPAHGLHDARRISSTLLRIHPESTRSAHLTVRVSGA